MARIRILRPEIWDDPIIGSLSRDARLLLFAVNTFADDEGLLAWDAHELSELAFTFDQEMGPGHVHALMNELTGLGIVFPYTVGANQRAYGYVVGFRAGQKIDRPSISKLPPPDIDSLDALTMYLVRDGWVCYLCGRVINDPALPDTSPDQALDRGVAEPLGTGRHPSSIRAAHLSCARQRADQAPSFGVASEPSQGTPASSFLVEPLTEPFVEPLTEDSVRVLGHGELKPSPATVGTTAEITSIPALTCGDVSTEGLSEPLVEALSESFVEPLPEGSLRTHRGKGKERNGRERKGNGGRAAVTTPNPTFQTTKTAKTTSTTTASRRPSPAATPPAPLQMTRAPSKDMSEDGCTTKASQDDNTSDIPVKAALNTTNPTELNKQPEPAGIGIMAVIRAEYETKTGEDPLEQDSLFGDDPAFASVVKADKPAKTPKAPKKPNPHWATARRILEPWWEQFQSTQILTYPRILKTVLGALEHGIDHGVLTAALTALGHEKMPVTPGALQVAISNLGKVPAGGSKRPASIVGRDRSDGSTYSKTFG